MENFRFFGGAYGVPGAELEQRIERLLRVIDLEEKKNTAAQSLVRRNAPTAGDRLRVDPRSAAAVF